MYAVNLFESKMILVTSVFLDSINYLKNSQKYLPSSKAINNLWISWIFIGCRRKKIRIQKEDRNIDLYSWNSNI